jgi:hypothetical protein
MISSMDRPLAFHITFGTYGTRLHGDARGTVDRAHNQYGEPIIGANAKWESDAAALLKFPPAILTNEQRTLVESTIPPVCERGGWKLAVCAAQEDRVHTLLSAPSEGVTVRRLLKRWLSDAMSEKWPRGPGQVW